MVISDINYIDDKCAEGELGNVLGGYNMIISKESDVDKDFEVDIFNFGDILLSEKDDGKGGGTENQPAHESETSCRETTNKKTTEIEMSAKEISLLRGLIKIDSPEMRVTTTVTETTKTN